MPTSTEISLRDNKEKILCLWEERALKEVASASKATNLALRDSLPLYLDHLHDALAASRKMDVKSVIKHDNEAIRIGKMHGADRAGTVSYVLNEVIFEYHILREVIFEVMEPEEALSKTHRDIILDSVEQAVNDAAVKFSEVHADIQQKFVNTLTHDLKTPITSVKLAAQLILKRSDQPDDCLRSAGRIIGNVNRLDSMIHNLLDVSRLRAGEDLSLNFAQCDFSAIARDVVDEMSDVHGSRIRLKSKGTIQSILSADGLRRTLENLISNAIKYGDSKADVWVELSQNEVAFQFSVHNVGHPILESELPLLFQQYRRAKSAQESNETGWGLGLALVKGVVDAHQGTIEVESTEEKGTTFQVEIPFARDQKEKTNENPSS